MDDEQKISYLAFESSQARMERLNFRLFIIIIVLIVALIGTNSFWIWYESKFEDIVVTQEATSDGSSDISVSNVNGDYYGREGQTNR